MIPIYVSYLALGADQAKKGEKGGLLANSLMFVLGFSAIFMLMGVFAGSLGKLFVENMHLIELIGGGIILLMGLNFLGVFNLSFLHKHSHEEKFTFASKKPTYATSLVFGVAFAFGWTHCTGVFLASVLMLAANSTNVLTGVLMLLAYSLGLGIPFVLTAALFDRLTGFFAFIKKHRKAIDIISGALLVVMGILMMTGLLEKIFDLLNLH